jgi:hypothetical protein
MLSKLIVLVILLLTYGYILYPRLEFPLPPEDALQSHEEADTETFYRRAYFTNYSRDEVIAHYSNQFNYLPFLRLNYPPEDAQTLIRDQTRSTFLEELVHPFRNSIYINGFKPAEAKDEIRYMGYEFEQKIHVRYVPGSPIIGLVIVTLAALLATWTINEVKLEKKT